MMNEAWRYLDGRRRQGLRRQIASVVIIQDDSLDATDSITNCGFTTDARTRHCSVWPSNRTSATGCSPSAPDGGQITTVPKSKIGANIGRLDDADILRLNQAVIVFLGLAVSPRLKP
ncbi:type II toxin-antitoxin system PemK/MazF family toxin [Mesorhizobium sp. BHbdii]